MLNEKPSSQNSKLPWRNYCYGAQSDYNTVLRGYLYLDEVMTRDDITHRVLELLTVQAKELKVPWNVFNVDLVIKAI